MTPDMLTGLTVAPLDALEGHVLPVSKNQRGKQITDSTWYFVFSMPEDTAKRLTEGRTVTVRFSRDWAGEIDMTVERIGTPENGRLAVTLSSNRFLSDTTLLRRQTVELVFSSRIGIRVPREAVRVETVTETETDPDTKEERQVERQVTCVYVQVGINAELKPVTILAQGEDYYVVESAIPKDAKDSQAKKALRSGDLVIVAGEDIWDGKVLG